MKIQRNLECWCERKELRLREDINTGCKGAAPELSSRAFSGGGTTSRELLDAGFPPRRLGTDQRHHCKEPSSAGAGGTLRPQPPAPVTPPAISQGSPRPRARQGAAG